MSLQVNSITNHPVNLIFMIPDGFGPASEAFSRQLYQHELQDLHKNDGLVELPLDSMVVGLVETSSLNIENLIRDPRLTMGRQITDSAAGATSYSCGLKTFSGAIAG